MRFEYVFSLCLVRVTNYSKFDDLDYLDSEHNYDSSSSVIMCFLLKYISLPFWFDALLLDMNIANDYLC